MQYPGFSCVVIVAKEIERWVGPETEVKISDVKPIGLHLCNECALEQINKQGFSVVALLEDAYVDLHRFTHIIRANASGKDYLAIIYFIPTQITNKS